MIDQSFNLALGVAALLFEFAVAFAMTGDPDHAFRSVSARHNPEQNDQETIENLFWD